MDKFPDKFTDANLEYFGQVKTHGPFRTGRPSGVTIHYSADRSVKRVVNSLKETSLGYHILIDRDGTLYQLAPLDQTVWHAGKAVWKGMSPNRHHISVSLMSWGEVKHHDNVFKSWADVPLDNDDIAIRKNLYWDAATFNQEEVLFDFLDWSIEVGIHPMNVCGHDECCIPFGRKLDPGGVVSMSLPEIREALGVYKSSITKKENIS